MTRIQEIQSLLEILKVHVLSKQTRDRVEKIMLNKIEILFKEKDD